MNIRGRRRRAVLRAKPTDDPEIIAAILQDIMRQTRRPLPSRPILSILVVGLLVTSLAGLLAPRQMPASAQAEPSLAFTDLTDDASIDLFTIDATGVNRRALLESPGSSETAPAWSPDGRQLVFSAPAAEPDRGLFVLDTLEGEVFAVTDGPVDLQPAWSPDGAWIAFARHTELDGALQSSALALVRPNGSDQRILTLIEGGARIIGRPAWSPDGRRILFELRQEAGGGADLYVFDRQSAELSRLLGHPGWDDIEPAWSPDGRRIAFASGPFELSSARSRHDIWLLDLETGDVGTILRSNNLDLRRPAWSPNGAWLAFDAGALGSLERRLQVAPATGAENLGTTLTDGFAAAWRPVGSSAVTATPDQPSPTVDPTDELPTPISSSTPIVDPSVEPLPTLVPFPTFPPPEPTEPGPAPTFPSPSPTATEIPSLTPTSDAAPGIYLPFLLRLHPEPSPSPTGGEAPATEAPTPATTPGGPETPTTTPTATP